MPETGSWLWALCWIPRKYPCTPFPGRLPPGGGTSGQLTPMTTPPMKPDICVWGWRQGFLTRPGPRALVPLGRPWLPRVPALSRRGCERQGSGAQGRGLSARVPLGICLVAGELSAAVSTRHCPRVSLVLLVACMSLRGTSG